MVIVRDVGFVVIRVAVATVVVVTGVVVVVIVVPVMPLLDENLTPALTRWVFDWLRTL